MVKGKLFNNISVDKAIWELGLRSRMCLVTNVCTDYYELHQSSAFFPQSNYSFRMIVTVNSD